jgi:ribosomal protein S1
MADETTGAIDEGVTPDASSPVAETTSMEDFMPPLDQIDVPGGEDDMKDAVRDLRTGDVITGTVVHIDPRDGVLVDVGMKSEGLIRLNELSRDPVQNIEDIVKVGDKVDVLVMNPEGRDGQVLLSKKRADFEKAWDRVQECEKSGEIVTATVTERVKGGLVVDLGIRGFVPASHVGNGKLKNLEKFVGTEIPLKVLEVDRHNRKVVLSHREATEAEREKQKGETMGALEIGQIRTGVVRRLTDYGAFVDLGGIDGLLHVSEIGWTRVKHPSDVLKNGQEVQVMVLRLNLEEGRVSLGMRQILPDPWTTVAEKYRVGETVEGEITRLVPFGAFVLLEGDIEGIIPNSELAHRRIAKASDVVESGQIVQVKVLDVRPDERRLTLSLRALAARDAEADFRPGAPAPVADDATGKRKKKGGRRGEEDAGAGVDYRSYISRGGNDFGATLGDMFGEMFKPKATGKREKRRAKEEEDDDLSDFQDDFDAVPIEGDETVVVASTEVPVEPTATEEETEE